MELCFLCLPYEDEEENMLSWESEAPITKAVIWYNEYLDKVTQQITVASVTVNQRCW